MNQALRKADRRIETLFQPGRNCWRVERADDVALIRDAAAYFVALREAIIAARHEVILIGWDFDFEIEMLPGDSDAGGNAPDGLPNALGPFLEEVVRRNQEVELHILKWNGAVLAAPGRMLPSIKLWAFGDRRIHFALDSHHPFGACHHQKIAVIDDALAFCGGIDVTEERWDTPDHLPDDPRRTRRDGSLIGPWHDVTTAITGPAARALGDLARMRWARATGEHLGDGIDDSARIWPASLTVDLEDVHLAIARTEPPYDGTHLINEIEMLFLDAIRAARKLIYIESQYLTTHTVCALLCSRLAEADGPEIIVINPQAARGGLEDNAMHALRGRQIDMLRAADTQGRFGLWHPRNAAGVPIYVHAKVLIVDDVLLRIGSSNLNNRSMGFDTECDVAFTGRQDRHAEVIGDFRNQLLAEHLDVEVADILRAVDRQGSWVGAVRHLSQPTGRGLERIVVLPETRMGRWLADTEALDQRFYPGEQTNTGAGIRPRHLVLAAAVGAGLLGLLWWQRRRMQRR